MQFVEGGQEGFVNDQCGLRGSIFRVLTLGRKPRSYYGFRGAMTPTCL